jgi:hypothetical protein
VALDRRQQVHLYERCRDALGDEAAGYFMSALPPFDWDTIATKHDVEVLEHKLTAAFERALRTQTKTYIAWTTALTAMLVAVFTGITAVGH